MNKCPFCEIVEHVEAHRKRILWEYENYIGMLVSHPETVGHFILFPKVHHSSLQTIEIREFFELAYRLAEMVIQPLQTKAYTLKVNNKVYLLDNNPLHVGHIHIHIIPRYEHDVSLGGPPQQIDVTKLEKTKQLIKAYFA